MFKSALMKMTLWYVALTMVLSLSFSFVIYHYAADELSEGLHSQYNKLSASTQDHIQYSGQEYAFWSARLMMVFVYFNLAVLVLASTISYFLAKKTLRPIEESHNAQIRFTAQASHELRTPLTAMRADTESILMNKSDNVTLLKQTLKANLVDLERLELLANHLLEVSRIRTNKADINQEFDLAEVVFQSINQIKRAYPKKKSLINFKHRPLIIFGDPLAIQLVISTILDNSIKYSGAKPQIDIRLIKHSQSVEINIKDKGIGIPSSDLSNVFKPFFRSNNLNSLNGYGLGLSIAKEVIESHKGKINITSPNEKGTVVEIILPL